MEIFSSPLGDVELTAERERHIFQFHPEVKKFRKQFAKTLSKPDTTRRSRHDPKVFILYLLIKKHYLAIVIKVNQRNFILTAYITSKIANQT